MPPSNGSVDPFGRLPPQAVEAEMAVLGAMMLDGRAIDAAREIVAAEAFYYLSHGLVYQAILDLHDQAQAVDGLTITAELKRRKQLDEVGGVIYVTRLSSEVATWANIKVHADLVAEAALRRRVINLSHEVQKLAYEGADPAPELIRQVEDRLQALSGLPVKGGLWAYEGILSDMLAELERRAASSSPLAGISTGFRALDELTAGLQKGDLIILASRPSVGKTALALSFTHTAIETGQMTALFSLEMSRHQLAQRHCAMRSNISLHRMRTGRLQEAEWLSLARQVGPLAALPLYVDDSSEVTVPEIRSRCRKLKREKGLGLVVIDYLQLMACHQRTTSREQEVAIISRGLKALAKELEVPVLALSQLSRALESRQNRRPQLSDLRESGSLEQDADVVMLLYRPEIYNIREFEVGNQKIPSARIAELILAKQRNGPTGSVVLEWIAEYARFEEHNLAPASMEE